MRGNQYGGVGMGSWDWSIPAYAGEPTGGDGRTAMCGVYPRVCGGTDD